MDRLRDRSPDRRMCSPLRAPTRTPAPAAAATALRAPVPARHRTPGALLPLVVCALLLGLAPPAAAGAQDTALAVRVDSVFAEWDSPSSPGCALGVARDGELVYARGYGSAHLDYRVPITPSSVFYMASVSKQFVAAAITLAAEQGHLSLDDDVRRWMPELPDYEHTIRVRHLIHHTSGLRDYLTLMRLAGMRYGDVHPRDEILGLVARQRELNFAPGDDYLYSNTGYFLLALIVERATGQSLREYTTEHMFDPLGMEDTHFHDDARHVQPNRAISYGDGDEEGKFRITFLGNFDQVGSGGLYSTVEDMVRWDRAFQGESPIGGPNFIDTLHTRGLLNDGDTLDYAFGLSIGEHNGLRTVAHGGSMMGYRTALLRFPDERFTVVTLCNLGGTNPSRLAQEVADIHLAERYPRFAFADEADGETDAEADDEDAADGAAEDAEGYAPSAAELRALVGSYYSPELDVTYELTLDDDALTLRTPGAERSLSAESEDVFEAGPLELHFARDGAGAVTGFRLMAGRVRNLRFVPSDADAECACGR